MTSLPVSAKPQPVRSVFGFDSWVSAKARPFAAGLLLLALMLVYCSVVQGSVQRGQLLNQQMVDTSSRCDVGANRSRAPDCNKFAAAGAARNGFRPPLSAAPAAAR